MQKTREYTLIAFVFLSLLAVFFYDIFFLSKTFKNTSSVPQALNTGPYGQINNRMSFYPLQSTDSSQMEEPLYQFVKSSLRQGTWPLWNPHQGCGFPFIAMMEVAMFFPLSFIMYFLPSAWNWDILILSRFFVAGFLTYAFMRTLRFGRLPSLAAGLTFMFSGPMIVVQYWFTNVDILAPLVLLTLERLARRPGLRNSCWVGLTVALTFLAGHQEHILFVNSFGFAYFCFRLFALRTYKKAARATIALFLGYTLGIGMSALTLLPFLYNAKTELWHSHNPQTALEEPAQDKKELIGIIHPYYFQKEPVKRNWDRVGWWGGYIGMLPFIFTLLSLFGRHKRGVNYFFAGIAFLIIAKTYFNFRFYDVLEILPLFRECKFYPHTLHLFAFNIAICTGLGLRWVLTQKRSFQYAATVVLPILALSLGVLWYFRAAPHFGISLSATTRGFVVALSFLLLLKLKDVKLLRRKFAAAALFCLLATELFVYIPRMRAKRFDSFPQVPYIEFIKNLPQRQRVYGVYGMLNPNTASGYQVDDFGIFISLLPKRFVEFTNTFLLPGFFRRDTNTCSIQVAPITFSSNRRPIFNMLNVSLTIGPQSSYPFFLRNKTQELYRPVYLQEAQLYPAPESFARAYVLHTVIFEPDEKALFSKIALICDNLRDVAVVHGEADPMIMAALTQKRTNVPSTAFITKYSPDEVVIEADLKQPGFVVLSDLYHPDWKAFLDGRQTKMYFTNGLVRSVFVPSGKHIIKFVFRPWSFYLGVCVSAGFLVLTILILVFTRWKKT